MRAPITKLIKKYHSKLFIGLFFSTAALSSYAQNYNEDDYQVQFQWPEGKQSALSISFDDARPSQLSKGIPILDKYNVKATFYVSTFALPGYEEKWKTVIKNGHEIGNHTTRHPCSGNFAWTRLNDVEVEDFTIEEIRQELTNSNKLIHEKLGVLPKTFAYPCGQTAVGKGANVKSYVPIAADIFSNSRLWLTEYLNDPSFVDIYQLAGSRMDDLPFSELLPVIKQAQKQNRWVIFAGHDVGVGGQYSTREKTLKALIEYAQDPKNKIWLDTVSNIADYVKAQQKANTTSPE